MRALVYLCLMMAFLVANSQEIFINEFMSSNNKFIFDEDNEDSDWIEIYNASTDTIWLANYCISDNVNKLTKWCFPDTTIRPGEFMLVFASGKDRAKSGSELHTNFKISASGENLLLSKNGLLIQHIDVIELETNTSYGSYPDGTLNYFVFLQPSPDLPNYINPAVDFISFSQRGGIYDKAFSLTITTQSDNRIFYTLDGSTPSVSSLLYTEPLVLNHNLCSPQNISFIQISPPQYFYPNNSADILKSIVIKAAAFDSEDNRISSVETNSYFIKELNVKHNLPIISITANYDDLFDEANGILVPGIYQDSANVDWTGNYYMSGIEWEREIFVEFYEPNNKIGFRQDAGLRTHGGNSRRFPQKGLRLYARKEYGNSNFNYQVFSDRKTDKYKRLVLRPFESSWTNAGIEDYIAQKSIGKLNIDRLASRPIILYINGEYWGIYTLQERIDQHYISTYNDCNPDSIDLITNWFGNVDNGSADDFLDLFSFINNNDLSIKSNYEAVENRMDIDNFIDYQIFQIFIINYDWPANNMKCWRANQKGSKWRWIFYDGDAGLYNTEYKIFEHAMSEAVKDWPTNAVATLFFRKLLENQVFKDKFFYRLEQVLNNDLAYSTLKPLFLSIFEEIKPEISLQSKRFAKPLSDANWYASMGNIDNFLSLMPCVIKESVKKIFDVDLYITSCDGSKPNKDIKDIVLYPNPNRGTFSLNFTSSSIGVANVYIVNSFGQTVFSQTDQIIDIDNHLGFENLNLPQGVYIAVIVMHKKVFSTKFLVVE